LDQLLPSWVLFVRTIRTIRARAAGQAEPYCDVGLTASPGNSPRVHPFAVRVGDVPPPDIGPGPDEGEHGIGERSHPAIIVTAGPRP
jgi:hypothetical protein